MVRTYYDMDELLTIVIKVEKVVGEIKETPYEPLSGRKEELALGKTNIIKHLQALNLVNYFGRGVDGKINHNLRSANTIQCQL